jgi:DNA polymerase elongation subunit (family B)
METMPCQKTIGQSKMPIHMGLLDYMEVFMNTKPYKVVENYKLDYIANLVLGTRKLHQAYATMMEAQQDIENFVKYNIIDTILVKLIEDKLGLLDVAFAISKFARVDVSKVFSAVFITETLMCREFLERGRFMASDRREIEKEATYDGAYVAKPEPGYYKYVSCFDFASMYPNIQIQFNISPDAYIGKIKPDTQKTPETIITKNDTIFTKQFDSAARTILTRLYNGRVDTKNEMKRLEEQLDGEKANKTN